MTIEEGLPWIADQPVAQPDREACTRNFDQQNLVFRSVPGGAET